mmetsp:Transcript_2088/g.4634  ORF Transcript_2088/g.4634 Transcript_2088/m.4634 type:complete len:206 (+) Transcript_2088:1080-1697(+)
MATSRRAFFIINIRLTPPNCMRNRNQSRLKSVASATKCHLNVLCFGCLSLLLMFVPSQKLIHGSESRIDRERDLLRGVGCGCCGGCVVGSGVRGGMVVSGRRRSTRCSCSEILWDLLGCDRKELVSEERNESRAVLGRRVNRNAIRVAKRGDFPRILGLFPHVEHLQHVDNAHTHAVLAHLTRFIALVRNVPRRRRLVRAVLCGI